MSSELVKVTAKPQYLAELPPDAIDNSDIQIFRKPPRLRVVQALSRPPLKPPFKEGDIVVVPQLIKVGDAETPVTFVPVHFFPSWVCLNPINMQGSLRSIREISFDSTSELARKCKSFVSEKCPESPTGDMLKYNETLNFMCILDGVPDLEGMPIHLFFSRGEFGTGQKLIGDILLRNAPRYACRFRMVTSEHTNKKGQVWQGVDIYNDPQPWVEEVNFHRYKALYEELKKLVDSQSVELDLEDPETPEVATEF